MGWRGQIAYDEEEGHRRRKFPMRERYKWPEIFVVVILLLAFVAAFELGR
jgi:hypothetical protein